MDRGTLRTLAQQSLGGDSNFTDPQVNTLLDAGIRDIASKVSPKLLVDLWKRGPIRLSRLRNGEFEDNDGTFVDGWALGGTAALNTTTVHTGATSIALVTDADSIQSANFRLSPSTAYTARAYLNATGSAQVDISATLHCLGHDGQSIGTDSGVLLNAATDGSWTQGTAPVTSVAGSVQGYLAIDAVDVGSSTVHVDDVRLTVAGQGRFPRDFIPGSLSQVYVDNVPAREYPKHQVNSLAVGGNVFLQASATSPGYSIMGTELWYEPSAAATIEALYVRKPVELVNDGSEPEIPEEMQSLLLSYVAWWSRTSTGMYEEAERHRAAYELGLARFVEAPPQAKA